MSGSPGYVDVFFAVIMKNSCNSCYFSSFSDVLGVYVASAALLQLMADRGGEASGEREIFSRCLRSTH